MEKLHQLEQELTLLEKNAVEGWTQHVSLSVSIMRRLITEIMQPTYIVSSAVADPMQKPIKIAA